MSELAKRTGHLQDPGRRNLAEGWWAQKPTLHAALGMDATCKALAA